MDGGRDEDGEREVEDQDEHGVVGVAGVRLRGQEGSCEHDGGLLREHGGGEGEQGRQGGGAEHEAESGHPLPEVLVAGR